MVSRVSRSTVPPLTVSPSSSASVTAAAARDGATTRGHRRPERSGRADRARRTGPPSWAAARAQAPRERRREDLLGRPRAAPRTGPEPGWAVPKLRGSRASLPRPRCLTGPRVLTAAPGAPGHPLSDAHPAACRWPTRGGRRRPGRGARSGSSAVSVSGCAAAFQVSRGRDFIREP